MRIQSIDVPGIYIYIYTCVYVDMANTFNRVRINWIWLPILPTVSWTRKTVFSLSLFAPRNLLPWDGLGRSVPRQPAHSLYSGWIWRLLMRFLPLSATSFIDTANRYGSVPNLSGHACPVLWTCQLSIAVIYYLARATTSHLGVDCTCVQEVCECIVGVGYRFHKELDWLK